ncbi:hypothetical protein Efla_003076 [Eimeria flavescens]
MGTCAVKYGEGAHELGSSRGRKQVVAEPLSVSKQKRGESTIWRSSSSQRRAYQLYPEGVRFGSTPSRQRYLRSSSVSPLRGLRICGVPPSTVPESQPYLASVVQGSFRGRFRARQSPCKLKVTDEVSSSAPDMPRLSSPRECRSKGADTSCSSSVKQSSSSNMKAAQAKTSSPASTCNETVLHARPTVHEAGVSRAALNYWRLDATRQKALWTSFVPSPLKAAFLKPLSDCCCPRSGRAWRLCVTSVSTDLPQANFEEKAVRVTGANSTFRLADIGISVVCKKGYRPNCPNNDGFFVFHVCGCTVCCVLDGHGPFGHDVCNVVQRELMRLTTSNPALSSQPRRILQEAILSVHRDLTTNHSNRPLDSKLSGATATIVVYLREQNKLVVAHVGNSRAVLCKLGKRGSGIRAIDLTADHTPSSITELRRIVKAEYKLDVKRDLFLLLCTDGVWNTMSSQEAIELVHSAKREGRQMAPEALARESWRRWIYHEQLFADDITALLMEFS